MLLTFDDGPHPDGTPAVLAELDRVGASAVFFVSGEQVERYPELVPRDHRRRPRARAARLPPSDAAPVEPRRLLADDMRRALDAVAAAAGSRPRLYRPPHGVFSLAGLRLIRELGLEPLLWSKWGRDWERGATPETVTARATAGLAAGDVVLLHDADHYSAPGSWRTTVAAVGPIAARIAAAGLQTASV